MEFESEKRLAPYTPKSQQEQMQVVAIEKTKVMDQLYIKYGVKAVDLIRANGEMNIDDDDEIKMLKNMIKAEREKLAGEKKEKLRQSLLLQGEQREEIKQKLEEAGPIDTTPTVSGVIETEEYMKIFKIMIGLQILFMTRVDEDNKVQRKAALGGSNQQAYAMMAQKQIQESGVIKQKLVHTLLDLLSLDNELYDKSGEAAKQIPEVSEKMKEMAKTMEHEARLKM